MRSGARRSQVVPRKYTFQKIVLEIGTRSSDLPLRLRLAPKTRG